MLYQSGRAFQRVVWVDPEGVAHTILLACVGNRVVWDGHVSQVKKMPVAVERGRGLDASVSAGLLIDADTARGYGDTCPAAVSSAVTFTATTATGRSYGHDVGVIIGQLLDTDTATGVGVGHDATVSVIAGAVMPAAHGFGTAHDAQITAGVSFAADITRGYGDAHAASLSVTPILTSDAPATGSGVGHDADVSTAVRYTPSRAIGTGSGYSANIVAGANLTTSRATGTGVGHDAQFEMVRAIAFDALGGGVSNTTSKTPSWSHTVGGKAKTYALVAVTASNDIGDLSSPDRLSVKWGNTAMTYLGGASRSGSSAVALFGLANVSAGVATVQVTSTMSSSGNRYTANSVTYSGVGAVANLVTRSGDNPAVSVSVDTEPGSWTVAAIGTSAGRISGITQNARWNTNVFALSDASDGGPTTTHAATQSTYANWSGIGVNLRQQ